MADGKTTGDYVVFADGFAGAEKAPGRAAASSRGSRRGAGWRTVRRAMTRKGRIWRITHLGAGASTARRRRARRAPVARRLPSARCGIAHGAAGLHRRATRTGRDACTAARLRAAPAPGCHGADGRGSQVGREPHRRHLAVERRRRRRHQGHHRQGRDARPSSPSARMPPLGAAPLQPPDVDAVAAYVWAISHRSRNAPATRRAAPGRWQLPWRRRLRR